MATPNNLSRFFFLFSDVKSGESDNIYVESGSNNIYEESVDTPVKGDFDKIPHLSSTIMHFFFV